MTLVFLSAICFTAAIWKTTQVAKLAKSKTLISRVTLQEPNDTTVRAVISVLTAAHWPRNGKKAQQALFELPQLIDLIGVAIEAGESVFSALTRVVSRASGLLANEFRYLLEAVNFGSTFEDELNSLARRVAQQQITEFSNKLALALRRGTPLARMLHEQASSVRSEIQNQLAKQAGKNETRMLIPLVFLILPVTVLFAIYPSLQLLNLSSI